MIRGATVAAVIVLAGGAARANGRFPVAQFLTIGPAEESSTFALSTTFGLVTSFDGGSTWQLTCEEGLGFDQRTEWDLTTAITADNTLVMGLPDGAGYTRRPACSVE